MGLLSYMATHADDLLEATAEHLMLLGATMLISCAIAALITVACLRSRPLGNAVVEVLGAAYAIPSLALFALAHPSDRIGLHQRRHRHGGIQPVHARPQCSRGYSWR